MEKYVYNLTDFAHRVSKDGTKWVNSDNLKGFTFPDIEPGSNEVSGYSGLNGTIQVIDWANISALEMSLKYSTMPESGEVLEPGKQYHQFVWTEQFTDKNQDVGWITYKAYITGMLKKIPGGDFNKGENNEREFTYGVNTYKFTRVKVTTNDKGETVTEESVLVDYDPINKVLVLNDVDYGAKMNTALASF